MTNREEVARHKEMILKQEFTQNFPNDSVCSKINGSGIPPRNIISIESHRYEPDQVFPIIVTVWYIS
jgi:hypothetical protein